MVMPVLRAILVVAAVRQEIDRSGFRSDRDVKTLFTGMGAKNALGSVRKSLAAGRYRMVISAGFSGGTRPGLRVGDLVVASEVIDDSSVQRWVPPPLMVDLPGSFSIGPLVTSSRAVPDPEGKAQLGARYGAVAVDMETAAVAQAASEAGLPWVSVRAILDPMEVPLTIRSRRQALYSLMNPSRWMDFSSFLGAMKTAGRSLADGLNLVVSQTELKSFHPKMIKEKTDGFREGCHCH